MVGALPPVIPTTFQGSRKATRKSGRVNCGLYPHQIFSNTGIRDRPPRQRSHLTGNWTPGKPVIHRGGCIRKGIWFHFEPNVPALARFPHLTPPQTKGPDSCDMYPWYNVVAQKMGFFPLFRPREVAGPPDGLFGGLFDVRSQSLFLADEMFARRLVKQVVW